MLLSLLIKVLILQRCEIINSDAVLYLAAAQKHADLLFHEGLRYYPMPFYPMLLALVHVVVPDWLLAGQLLTVLPLVLAVWPLYVLTMRLFDRTSALCTALLFAVLPVFNNNSSSIMRDPLFLFLFLCALLCLVVAYQEQTVRAIVSLVLCTGLAVLTRVEGVVLLPVALLALGVFWWRNDLRIRALWLAAGIVFSLICAVVSVINGADSGDGGSIWRLDEIAVWMKQLVDLTFFSIYQSLLDEMKKLQQLFPGADMHNNLFEVARHYAPVIYLIGLAEMVIKAIFPTSLLAFAAWRWRVKRSVIHGRWLIVIMWFVAVSMNLLFTFKMNFTTERYLWMVIILSLPWIGYGMSLWWQNRSWRNGLAKLVVALIIIAPLTKTVVVAAQPVDTTIINAGRWLHDYDVQRQLTTWYNDRSLVLYAERIDDVVNVHSLELLRTSARENKNVDIVALYLSNKKNEDVTIPGFEMLKRFQGADKTVLFLQRSAGG